MPDLYLIAHKVRGEPAFDIAIQIDVLDEDGDLIWIIPTSGHRAYPATYVLMDCVTPEHYAMMKRTNVNDVQDHYHLDAPARHVNLIDQLNLRPTLPPIKRRF